MDDVMVRERYELSKERLGVIMLEETVKEPYRDYFRKTAEFLLMLDEVQELVRNRDWESADILMLAEENRKLYEDILPEQYETSWKSGLCTENAGRDVWQFFKCALQ